MPSTPAVQLTHHACLLPRIKRRNQICDHRSPTAWRACYFAEEKKINSAKNTKKLNKELEKEQGLSALKWKQDR
jgi:hypothetical protein